MGDPAGCGPQITISAWTDRDARDLPPFFVIADPRLFAGQVPIAEIAKPSDVPAAFGSALPVLPLELLEGDSVKAGQPSPNYAMLSVIALA